ncbi:MAG: hypothetical protein WC508_05515 [Patescibacteria group bacterium]
MSNVVNDVSDWIGKRKVLVRLGAAVVIALLALLVFRVGWMTFVDKHELGYVFNRFSGEIKALDRSGWVITWPIKYDVNTIDLRPYQVSISVDLKVSQRILNAKLVRFNPEGLDTFIAWHGRGAGGDVESLKEILKCYAFDKQNGEDCPFLTVISELSPNQGEMIVKK